MGKRAVCVYMQELRSVSSKEQFYSLLKPYAALVFEMFQAWDAFLHWISTSDN